MFEATQDGLGRNAPVHSIHGSLLAVGELLRLLEIETFTFFIMFCFVVFSCLSSISLVHNSQNFRFIRIKQLSINDVGNLDGEECKYFQGKGATVFRHI